MPDIVLAADSKRSTGSSNSRRLRHTGRVPAVVYGHGIDPTSVSVDARQLRSALSTSAGANVVLELDIEGTHHMAMAKVIDHHPVRHTIAHVDFLVVNRNEKVTADVPLVLVGEAEAVKRDGGVVDQTMHTITLTMLPGQIPDSIEVDITDLEPGGFVRIGELELPKGVETDLDPETPVVGAAHASEVGEVPVSAEAAEAAEAAAAAGDGAPEAGADAEGSTEAS
ncbi:MAG: 50S ribosomal protein L25/general stress protein Ctc [Acidimicrobiales bacterium]